MDRATIVRATRRATPRERFVIILCTAALAACGEKDAGDAPPAAAQKGAEVARAGLGESEGGLELPTTANLAGAALEEETFTFFDGYIEIDRLAPGSTTEFGDANLFAFDGTAEELANCTPPGGADPADGTCDARLPASQLPACANPMQASACACTGDALFDTETCIDVAFIDWNELLTDALGAPDPARLAVHRLLDDVKSDPSSFKNGSCVTSTQVLGKMDITAGAVANNAEYAYFALKRYDNNGDAGYSWIFTAVEPYLQPAPNGCSSGAPLIYPLTEGDVLIQGNFNPSAGAELTVRRATAAATGQEFLAQQIVDPNLLTGGNPVWAPVAGADNLPAVNTTITGAGVLEVIGGVDQAGNRTDKGAVSGSPGDYAYGTHIFAEAAVDLAVFMGENGASCDLSFYGTVVTQPSSAETSDLKDLFGPQKYNFGTMAVEAAVTPTCSKSLEYDVSHVTGPGIDTDDPDSIPAVSCLWTFTNGAATKLANDCSGTLIFDPGDPEGDWQADLEVTIDSVISCSTSETIGTVAVYEALAANADLTPGCGLDFDFTGSFTGGSATATAAWAFTGPGTVDPATSEQADGSATVTELGSYTGTFSVTDDRGDILCSTSAGDSVEVAAELSVTPILTPTCELSFGYDATINGGLGAPTIAWEFSGPGNTTPAASGTQSGAVDVDADGTYTGAVTVSEYRGDKLCEASGSTTVDAYSPLTLQIDLDETCTLAFDYASTVGGGSGGVTYDWAFSGPSSANPETAAAAAGSVAVGEAGNYAASLTVTDIRTDIECTQSANGTVDVFAPLIAQAQMVAACDLTFAYTGTIQGGSPAAVGSWTFPGLMNPAAGVQAGNMGVPSAGNYNGTFNVTDVLANGVECNASANASANPYAPIEVSIAPSAESLTCPAFGASDALTYTATVSGGDGNYQYSWSGCTPANGTCVVDPSDSDFCADASVFVIVDDGAAICAAAQSETETYTKVTVVTSSNN